MTNEQIKQARELCLELDSYRRRDVVSGYVIAEALDALTETLDEVERLKKALERIETKAEVSFVPYDLIEDFLNNIWVIAHVALLGETEGE
jgi:hypothetical protein